jgi:hypothetical protein
MRIIITESQYKKISRLITEESTFEKLRRLAFSQSSLSDFISSDDTDYEEDEMDDEDTEEISIEPGSYYVNPKFETVNIQYGPYAVKLNEDSEILLKSIVAKAGKDSVFVSSTLRTYDDQARVNKQNSRSLIIQWYCKSNPNCELVKKWDLFVKGEMSQQEYSDYLKKRDKELGKVISNHIPGLAIDIVPLDEKIASAAESIKGRGNSGITKVLREPTNGVNGALHLEFSFPVTGVSGAEKPKLTKKSKVGKNLIQKETYVIDIRNPKSKNFALVYGGSPSWKYGADFMYEKGKNYLNGNVIYADNELSIDEVQSKLNEVVPNAKIKTVSGFSGGGSNALRAMDSGKYDFIGLIDPYIKNVRSSLPSNVEMISRYKNWTGDYSDVSKVLNKMEDMGVSDSVNIIHDDMPAYFFDNYADKIIPA